MPKVLISGRIENITLNLPNKGNTQINFISMHVAMPNIDGTFLGLQPIQVRSIAPRSSIDLPQSVFIYSNEARHSL